MPTLDEQIAQSLHEAQRSGELQSAASWGKPLDLDDGYARTPEELRLAYKALKEAGFVPPEVETMKQIAALRQAIEADPTAPTAEAMRRRASELQQHLALRLEKLRRTGAEKEFRMAATRSCVIPSMRFRDAPAAIEWLCDVFGFEKGLVVPNDQGGIAHAQLTLGGGMMMLGSTSNDNEYGQLVKQPDQLGGAQTQSCYLVVPDADAVHARAQAAGARIAMPLVDQDYGGRGFSCYDLEGHLWSIGTYDPWA